MGQSGEPTQLFQLESAVGESWNYNATTNSTFSFNLDIGLPPFMNSASIQCNFILNNTYDITVTANSVLSTG